MLSTRISFCPSVPTFQNSAKLNNSRYRCNFGSCKGIMDGTCLVKHYTFYLKKMHEKQKGSINVPFKVDCCIFTKLKFCFFWWNIYLILWMYIYFSTLNSSIPPSSAPFLDKTSITSPSNPSSLRRAQVRKVLDFQSLEERTVPRDPWAFT